MTKLEKNETILNKTCKLIVNLVVFRDPGTIYSLKGTKTHNDAEY